MSSGIPFHHVLNTVSREKLRRSYSLTEENSLSQATLVLTSA